MVKQNQNQKGMELEARVQRLFMCQGAFAERGLFVRAARGESKLVTDIDVVAHDYSINFHHRRIYAECKGGGNVSTLDRVVWVRGIKEIIGADFGYLVLDHCDTTSVSFAHGQDIEILQLAAMAKLESSLRIGADFWPGRSNLAAYSAVEKNITTRIQDKKSDNCAAWLMRAAEVWRDASHLVFSYGRLNSLLSTLKAIAPLIKGNLLDENDCILVKYALSALMVRLTQYVLFAASDTLGMAKTERESYIKERLTAGDRGIEQTRGILEGAINLVKAQLDQHHIEAPLSWNIDQMLAAPEYSLPFATVVERAIGECEYARTLPLSAELKLFGFGGKEESSGRLLTRARGGMELVSVIRGFVIQSLSVDASYCGGLGSEFATPVSAVGKSTEKPLFEEKPVGDTTS
jgi:hypothetical protein